MKKITIIFFCLIFCIQLFAQEKKLFWDGYDWAAVDKITREYPEYNVWIKSAYLSGLFDGKMFYKLKAMPMNNSVIDTLFTDLIEPSSVRSLIGGLDMFYQDMSSEYIPIPLALIATIMIQNDYSKSEVDKFILESKKWINEITISILNK
ncbi:MAG: hypothetical protein ISS81_03365 [Candidatus Marinimicrobia bacterium]|nr:hypothetical protein [Candidatus Neomarinimicrobiota bacterium]